MATSKLLNFNQFLASAKTGPHAALAAVWENKRGRMTAASVEVRALGYGMAPGAGTAAWADYTAAALAASPAA